MCESELFVSDGVSLYGCNGVGVWNLREVMMIGVQRVAVVDYLCRQGVLPLREGGAKRKGTCMQELWSGLQKYMGV